MEKIKVFIGSGEASVIERKVLIYSILKNTSHDVDIYVMNGTHDSLEKNGESPVRIDMSLKAKYMNFTEFSNYRFLIPQLCNFEGRAIFMDSDTVCLGDLKELYFKEMGENDILARKESFPDGSETRWALSVMLMDCNRCRFDLDRYVLESEQEKYSYGDFHTMSPDFQKYHSFNLGELESEWNEFDRYDDQTKIVHYTNLDTQPWKYAGHEYADLWFQYLKEARKAGFVTDEDMGKAALRFYIRREILEPGYII